jgi:hypothetical protein
MTAVSQNILGVTSGTEPGLVVVPIFESDSQGRYIAQSNPLVDADNDLLVQLRPLVIDPSNPWQRATMVPALVGS